MCLALPGELIAIEDGHPLASLSIPPIRLMPRSGALGWWISVASSAR